MPLFLRVQCRLADARPRSMPGVAKSGKPMSGSSAPIGSTTAKISAVANLGIDSYDPAKANLSRWRFPSSSR
jgi:hypothetical protein